MGTSLTVQPFAGLVGLAQEGVPRVLINREGVGGLGTRGDDVLVLGECDDGVRRVAEACGWLGELEGLWAGMVAEGEREEEDVGKEEGKGKDEALNEEIEQLTREVDETLRWAKWHEERVRGEGSKDGEGGGAGKGKYEVEGGHLGHVFGAQRGDGKKEGEAG
ncbi:NAD-dependent protein deacetylase hst2-1 [Teratosphaeria destructans]|uniref:NAD-dependent protein deacetylase hst2-1 n=1 Tax=Teratosphaeria destructans TaxID=418781 RepID=A0A9W7SV20_9PEZI|nr:NAD-dependent protein deacetylase hst2-1 [Teratosphaeria destructans]